MHINYLVIEGNIGVGKTSLSRKIAENMNAKLILEQFEDNPFLPKFYENPDRYSFPVELSFLADRYHQLKNNLDSLDLFSNLIVSDYFFMKSLIFSSSTLQEDEYKLYRQLFDIIYGSLPKPDLYVYLHKDVDNLLKNIINIRPKSTGNTVVQIYK
jgi:deoxyadenosine/deoxycytidine kinase